MQVDAFLENLLKSTFKMRIFNIIIIKWNIIIILVIVNNNIFTFNTLKKRRLLVIFFDTKSWFVSFTLISPSYGMNQHAWDLLIKNHQWKNIWTKKISHWNAQDLKPSNEVLNKVGKVKSLGWPNGNQSTHLCGCAEKPV